MDLPKALRLMVKGNAVVLEWLTSPIVYGGDPAFRDDMLALARDVARRDLIARHYLHLGLGQRRRHLGDGRAVPLKKIFYVLRPALALRWLRLHPGEVVVPMHFPTLLASAETPRDVAAIAEDLMTRKAMTREIGTGMLPAVIDRFFDIEFELAEQRVDDETLRPPDEALLLADAFFRRWLGVATEPGDDGAAPYRIDEGEQNPPSMGLANEPDPLFRLAIHHGLRHPHRKPRSHQGADVLVA